MKYTQSSGNTPTAKGPGDWFTGDVYIDGIRNPDDQSAVGCAHVRFTPGARTAWHHHPKGQPPTVLCLTSPYRKLTIRGKL
jgi:quercetin dioxygenase-like cupin family protein